MLNFLAIISILISYPANGEMLVRVYASDYHQLQQIDEKSLDIAGRRYQEYFDIVVTPGQYPQVVSSGLDFEVITDNIELLKEQVRGSYHSYSQVVDSIRSLASSYSNICLLDSIGPSYEGRWVYVLKISDNPSYEDPDEPGILFDALHHSREWATIEIILFYADTILSTYGSVPEITNLVDNNQIWLIPMVNVDGYVYDYPGQNWWRKNRKPFGGSTGTDPNRNYNGSLNGDPLGAWGVVPPNGSMSHNPSSEVFCGAYCGWVDVVGAMMDFYLQHHIHANITYHSYAEEILWPWSYDPSLSTPDSIAFENIANEMASRIHCLNGSNYVASGALYPLSGNTDEWVYGYHHYVKGMSCLSYCIEVGTAFYQPAGDLDDIVRENWKGALYLAQQADSIKNHVLPQVPSPEIVVPDTVSTSSCQISWIPANPDWNDPVCWQLDHLEGYSYSADDLEAGSSNWTFYGYSLSSTRHHSGVYSLYSGNSNNISNYAQTKYPYLVKNGDSLSFWCWYDLENNYDVTTVEISLNQMEWFQLDSRFTGTSGGWIHKHYSLNGYEGEAVYFRFRTMSDDNTNHENFYVDDIYPVPVFSSVNVIDSTIADTAYTLNNLTPGDHYFRVRGFNVKGWGIYSNTVHTTATATYVQEPVINYDQNIRFSAVGNQGNLVVSYYLPAANPVHVQVFDLSGRVIKQFRFESQFGDQVLSFSIPHSGVWFVRFATPGYYDSDKVLILK
ncbi:MAG: M14 family zinc carboxypeptidase [bacterium]